MKPIPDPTAVRTSLWRALHLEADGAPPILTDNLGLQLASPPPDWRQRPDMHAQGTRGYRASIVGRARFIEDLVNEQAGLGTKQYVILGAGLDTFALRSPKADVQVFEVDEPATQAWKMKRLRELGLEPKTSLRFVPVDFEKGESWREKLRTHGFDASKPAVFASTGVSMYLTPEANLASLKQITEFASGTILAMTFLLPMDLIDSEDRAQHEMVYERARAAGTPFVSFFRPEEIQQLAREAGFRDTRHVSKDELVKRYFAGRDDGLRPASGEEFLLAKV